MSSYTPLKLTLPTYTHTLWYTKKSPTTLLILNAHASYLSSISKKYDCEITKQRMVKDVEGRRVGELLEEGEGGGEDVALCVFGGEKMLKVRFRWDSLFSSSFRKHNIILTPRLFIVVVRFLHICSFPPPQKFINLKKHTYKPPVKEPPKLTPSNLIETWSPPSLNTPSFKSALDSKISSYESLESLPISTGPELDSDGWEIVTHKTSTSTHISRNISAQQTGHSKTHKRKRIKKRLCPEEGLGDFYRFQKKVKFKEERERVKEGWERDRERVRRLKGNKS